MDTIPVLLGLRSVRDGRDGYADWGFRSLQHQGTTLRFVFDGGDRTLGHRGIHGTWRSTTANNTPEHVVRIRREDRGADAVHSLTNMIDFPQTISRDTGFTLDTTRLANRTGSSTHNASRQERVRHPLSLPSKFDPLCSQLESAPSRTGPNQPSYSVMLDPENLHTFALLFRMEQG
jgi:hypothetical protein